MIDEKDTPNYIFEDFLEGLIALDEEEKKEADGTSQDDSVMGQQKRRQRVTRMNNADLSKK